MFFLLAEKVGDGLLVGNEEAGSVRSTKRQVTHLVAFQLLGVREYDLRHLVHRRGRDESLVHFDGLSGHTRVNRVPVARKRALPSLLKLRLLLPLGRLLSQLLFAHVQFIDFALILGFTELHLVGHAADNASSILKDLLVLF